MGLVIEKDEITPMLLREAAGAPDSFVHKLAQATVWAMSDGLIYDWQGNIQADKLVYHGWYLDMIGAQNDGWTGSVFGLDVVSRVPYGAALEYGSRPHVPPFKPLLDWCKWKGFDDPGGMAAAIRTRIAREGQAPRPTLRPAIASVKSRLPTIFSKAVEVAKR